jgi:hypothetical protein
MVIQIICCDNCINIVKTNSILLHMYASYQLYMFYNAYSSVLILSLHTVVNLTALSVRHSSLADQSYGGFFLVSILDSTESNGMITSE